MSFLELDSDLPVIRDRLAAGATLVACLCAEWCGSCREYRDVFAVLALRFPDLCFVWIDVEDHADHVEALEVENFPTILIEDAVHTRFFGTLLPQRGVLERLLVEFPHLPAIDTAAPLRAGLAV